MTHTMTIVFAFKFWNMVVQRKLITKISTSEKRERRNEFMVSYNPSLSLRFWELSRRIIFPTIFLLRSLSGHREQQLSNVTEILFQIKRLFEMEYQLEKNEQLFPFSWSHKSTRAFDTFVRRWIYYRQRGTEIAFAFKEGKFGHKDSPHSSWPVQFDENHMHGLVK